MSGILRQLNSNSKFLAEVRGSTWPAADTHASHEKHILFIILHMKEVNKNQWLSASLLREQRDRVGINRPDRNEDRDWQCETACESKHNKLLPAGKIAVLDSLLLEPRAASPSRLSVSHPASEGGPLRGSRF
jgi:hypothetical protein